MNYYYPYYYVNPASISNSNIFSSLFNRGGFSFNSLLNGAQRTLGLVNQVLPIIKEAAPLMRNAKTMFKVMNEFKKIDVPNNSINGDTNLINDKHVTTNYGGPTFFA